MATERKERQERLLAALRGSDRPRTGTELAAMCNVTRQVVVHDIAVLRASGVQIHATPRGYWLAEGMDKGEQSVLVVRHSPELTRTELYILVDHGIKVIDVFVEHAVYGELRGTLHLASRRDVDIFMDSIETAKAPLLSSLTEGFHYHTVECAYPERLAEAVERLQEAGVYVEDL